jgi:hypothetical protein
MKDILKEKKVADKTGWKHKQSWSNRNLERGYVECTGCKETKWNYTKWKTKTGINGGTVVST